LPEFFARVRSDPERKFKSRQEIIPAFESARQRIVGNLPRLFDVTPRAEFQIRALPESSRNSRATAIIPPPAPTDRVREFCGSIRTLRASAIRST